MIQTVGQLITELRRHPADALIRFAGDGDTWYEFRLNDVKRSAEKVNSAGATVTVVWLREGRFVDEIPVDVQESMGWL